MKKISLSIKIYVVLILVLAILAAVNLFLPQGSFAESMSTQALPASKPVMALANAAIMLIMYGGLGYLGIFLSKKLGFAEIWDRNVTNRQRFLVPAIWGLVLGLFFILTDTVASHYHDLGPLAHPPFPASLVASSTAGIGEEVIFRLFFISLWVWIISFLLLRKRWLNQVFWFVTLLSAVAFAAGHLPSVMFLYGFTRVSDLPTALLAELFLLNGTLSIISAYYFRKYGFLAAVGVHFWTDIVWHVIWGIM